MTFGVLLIGAAMPAKAQLNAEAFDLKYAKKPYHFGIALGYNTSTFKVEHDQEFLDGDSIRVVTPASGPGFNLGIVANLRMGNHFDLRFIPSLVFAEKSINYDILVNDFDTKLIESIYLQFPLSIKYKSDPYKDFRMYVIGGANYSYDLASNAKARNAEDQVKVLRHDVAAEVGVGMEFYFPYFILSPEIKVSHGLRNVHARDPDLIFSGVMGRLRQRAIMFTIHFEG